MTVPASTRSHDVTIVGGGLAGKAASIHLAKAGFKVLCIEPRRSVGQSVGESLDWSAPDLLSALGLPMEQLVQSKIATWKRHVTLRQNDGCSQHYVPSAWLGGKPFRVELRTLHVDRLKLDRELLQLAQTHGVELRHDKVVGIERDGMRVRSVVTADGSIISSPWFLDASGIGHSLFAREFHLPVVLSGPPKVALWTYFSIDDAIEGTTLHMAPSRTEYLEWVWEIPVQPDVISVGYVLTGTAMKAMRNEGLNSDEIFRRQLEKFPRFASLLESTSLDELHVTSFHCRTRSQASGPNWLLVGEAASMVDPITSNGVTAALRHSSEAASLIQQFRGRHSLPWKARFLYDTRIVQTAKFFNGGIEKIVYETQVRNYVGLGRAGTIYTGPAWSMNAVYARLKPQGVFSTFLLAAVLGVFRASAWCFAQVCKMSAPAEA